MKKQQHKKQTSAAKSKKPDLKIKKHPIKDLDPEKASQQVKGGHACAPTDESMLYGCHH